MSSIWNIADIIGYHCWYQTKLHMICVSVFVLRLLIPEQQNVCLQDCSQLKVVLQMMLKFSYCSSSDVFIIPVGDTELVWISTIATWKSLDHKYFVIILYFIYSNFINTLSKILILNSIQFNLLFLNLKSYTKMHQYFFNILLLFYKMCYRFF